MSKARLIGMNNAYIPNSKADARFQKNIHQRGRDLAERSEFARRNRRERREMARMKGARA